MIIRILNSRYAWTVCVVIYLIATIFGELTLAHGPTMPPPEGGVVARTH